MFVIRGLGVFILSEKGSGAQLSSRVLYFKVGAPKAA